MDDGESGVICHLQCEISSVSVTGLGCGFCGDGELFLRCHVPAGGGRAIQIDSNATTAAPVDDGGAASGVVTTWRDVASLRCDGSPSCVRELVERRSIVFEVRRRRRPGGIGRRSGALRRLLGWSSSSELLGRAEVAWRDAAATGIDDEAVERQVVLSTPPPPGRGARPVVVRGDAPTPVLSVRMTVRVSEVAAPAASGRWRRRVAGSAAYHESGWTTMGDEAVFGLAACAADDGAME